MHLTAVNIKPIKDYDVINIYTNHKTIILVIV